MDLMNALSFVAVASLLVISPGPNGVLIAKTVATSGKTAGFANVAGFVAAFHFHGALSILGISAILLASSDAFFIVKMLGAAYLCWIGIKALRDAFSDYSGMQKVGSSKQTGKLEATSLYHLKEIEHSHVLTADEEKSYARLVQKGDEKAREKMIQCNLRLVVKIARPYLNSGLSLTDLVEEGQSGLIHSVENFNPESGFRFSTYATWWIRQSIEQALMNQTRNIHLPIQVVKDINIYQNAEQSLQLKMDREPTANSASKLSAFVEGFLTNGLNPKTSMFYLAAFPQFITIGDGAVASAYILVLLHTLINVAWFGTMVILLARLARFSMRKSFQRWLKGVTGIVFIAFGVKLATFRV